MKTKEEFAKINDLQSGDIFLFRTYKNLFGGDSLKSMIER